MIKKAVYTDRDKSASKMKLVNLDDDFCEVAGAQGFVCGCPTHFCSKSCLQMGSDAVFTRCLIILIVWHNCGYIVGCT